MPISVILFVLASVSFVCFAFLETFDKDEGSISVLAIGIILFGLGFIFLPEENKDKTVKRESTEIPEFGYWHEYMVIEHQGQKDTIYELTKKNMEISNTAKSVDYWYQKYLKSQLTWEDIKLIVNIADEMLDNADMRIAIQNHGEEAYYTEVLKRFKEAKK